MTSIHQHSKPVRLAARAYQLALQEKIEPAARVVERIGQECGGEGVTLALMAWCDTYADHATDGQMGRVQNRMAFIEGETGRLDGQDSDRVPAEVRWAGKLIAARVALDHDGWTKLLDQLPDDPATVGLHVVTVLATIAQTVNGLPRGFARMGNGGAE